MTYAEKINALLYGPDSQFTAEEQAAMKRGFSNAERRQISGRIFGIYPQAISQSHAQKLDEINFPSRKGPSNRPRRPACYGLSRGETVALLIYLIREMGNEVADQSTVKVERVYALLNEMRAVVRLFDDAN